MIRRLITICAALLLGVAATFGGNARAGNAYAICSNQTYALCASASAFVYAGVSYAKCIIKQGDSISAPPLSYTTTSGKTVDICDINAVGAKNRFMMSTFSLPLQVRKGGNKALYTCRTGATASYAQCDGGTCFRSTSGEYFPGVGKVGKDEIVCSCPITKPDKINADSFTFQFIGPYPCQQKAFSACDQEVDNGSIIPVGSPPGAGRVLTEALYGHQFPINECAPN